MLDFTAVRNKEQKFSDLTANLTIADLRTLTNEMIDTMLHSIAESTDADVTFVPQDPNANDTFASNDADLNIAWTLGHVVVHTSASSEESAAIAAELARGVEHRGGRSRSEVPWETVTTIAQCRHRLEESRRMRLASLEMWPDQPDLANSYVPRPDAEPLNAVMRFVMGLRHDDDHVGQLADVAQQSRAARG